MFLQITTATTNNSLVAEVNLFLQIFVHCQKIALSPSCMLTLGYWFIVTVH